MDEVEDECVRSRVAEARESPECNMSVFGNKSDWTLTYSHIGSKAGQISS